MFSYRSSYVPQFDQHSFRELEAVADDLSYRASLARRAARLEARDFHDRSEQLAYLDEAQPLYTRARPRTGEFGLPSWQSVYNEAEPARRRYRREDRHIAFPLHDDYIDDPYVYAQTPSRLQHRPIFDDDFSYNGMSAEQYARDVQESRIHAAAERARVRAEARRAELFEQRARAEQQRAYARREREEREQAEMEAQSRVREIDEVAQAVAALVFGNESDNIARRPVVRRPTIPNRAAWGHSPQSLEDLLDQVVSLQDRAISPRVSPRVLQAKTNTQAHANDLSAKILRVHFNPTNVDIPRTSISKETPKHSDATPTDRTAGSSSPSSNYRRSPAHSPRLPIPGRTFSHLPQNPQDPGLTTEQLNRRSGAADEVADIVEAIKRSLDPRHNAKASDAEARPSAQATGRASPSSGLNSKRPVNHEQSDVASDSASPSQLGGSAPNAMAVMKSIECRLVDLTHQFVFPPTPDFGAESPEVSSGSTLLFTPTNQPIRAHEHGLTRLLTELDAVESDGDEDIRRVRKGLVSRIESELADLERKKEDAGRRNSGAWSANSHDEVEGYVIPPAPDVRRAHPEESTADGAAVPVGEASRESRGNAPASTHVAPESAAPAKPAGDTGNPTFLLDVHPDATETESTAAPSDAHTSLANERDSTNMTDKVDVQSAEFEIV